MRESNERKRKARADEKATETHEEKAARLEKQRLSKTTARAVEKATETHGEKVVRLEDRSVAKLNQTVYAYLDAFCDIVCPDDTIDNDEVCDGPDVADDDDEIINALEAVAGLVTERASDDDQYGHVNTSDDQVDVLRSPHIGSTDVDNQAPGSTSDPLVAVVTSGDDPICE
ncbi:hypothetical protein SDRG_05833 [Saprolegnia diclina VS20]|uniref:Uncharacterized protein n=1 Tax=Saprolegnia diclina (strain VS20) TaxID=1156394 RepID=T0QQL4_SAPDV|nr:hypothetical protein SDRG_05833 [Saprolegnia diclina VS20]EQC37016.1 hypothetical protein SDRG_05833 [Saprolegnia diclina VS20]|eukprot:XP_008609797.1 hypothetical protein SDRG_05833 [Saprolegnia diclina VS20]